MIVEEPPAVAQTAPASHRPRHLLTLSAKTPKALSQLTQQYADYLAGHGEVPLEDVCFAAAAGRSHFSQRLARGGVGRSGPTVLEVRGIRRPDRGHYRGESANAEAKLAFLFTGQGAQYVGMGRQLYQTDATFRRILDECDERLRPWLDRPLLSVMFADADAGSPLDQTAYTQPALFVLEYALAQLWQSWGIRPAAVMGHSIGEFVAACVAGVFSLEDGLELVAQRGRLMQALPAGGSMAAVLAGEDRVAAAIATVSPGTGHRRGQRTSASGHIRPRRFALAGACRTGKRGDPLQAAGRFTRFPFAIDGTDAG